MHRRVQDPIAEHSARLCEYMNSQPNIVLSYARYFGEYSNASSAKVTSVDQHGFDISCQDQGQEQEVRVTFDHPQHAPSQVRNTLMALTKEAESALRGSDPSKGSYPESPSVTFPDLDVITTFIVVFVSIVIYLEFFPNTKSPILQWVFNTLGARTIHLIVLTVAGFHVCESLISLYFTVVVGKGFFRATDIVQWFCAVLVLGYPVLFQLIRLAKSSKRKE